MARKAKSRARSGAASDSAKAIRDSAQKIWLAGLGAFERAKTEGPKMFETLVEQGRSMGARAVGAADEALKNMRYSGGKWDKLEQVFEDRVSKSLNRLGVLTNREVDELTRQVRDLNESVRGLMAGGSAKGAKRRSAAAGKSKAGARTKKKKKAAAGSATRASRARRA